jgi:hypothetical protein
MPTMRPVRAVYANALKIAVVAILSVPAVASLTLDRKPGEENRALASLPPMPRSLDAALKAPAAFTAWVNDSFGYRAALVALNNRLRFKLFREFPSDMLIAGHNDRYFLAKHVPTWVPALGIAQVCGNMGKPEADTQEYFNALFADFAAAGLHPRLLIVPSAPVLYPADLPASLAPNCSRSDTPAAVVLASPRLNESARAQIFYPLEEMRRIKDKATLFPKTWFHWTGEGLDEVARLSLEHFWPRNGAPGPALKVGSTVARSDMSHLVPGIELAGNIVEPDLEASGIKACFGALCIPELGDAGQVLGDITRFTNPAAPARRLVILSDSFGSKVSPWYARYYREVAQVSTNNVGALRPDQVAAVRAALLNDPAGTDLLLLFHDGSAVHNGIKLGVQRLHAAPAAIDGRVNGL